MWKILQSKKIRISFAVLLGIILLLPVVTRQLLIAAITANDFDYVEIANVDINLFNATIIVDGLSIKKEGEPKLTLGKLMVDMRWLGLLQSQLIIESALIKNANFAVIQHPSGDLEIVLPFASEPKQQGERQNNAPPKLAIEVLLVENINIAIQTQYGNGLFNIDQLQLTRLSTWQDQHAQLLLQAAWNGRPITAELSVNLGKVVPVFSGQIRADSLALDAFSRILPEPLNNLQAEMGFSFQFDGKRHNDNSIELKLDSTVSLNQLALNYGHFTTGFKAFLWQGEIELLQTKQNLTYQLLGQSSLADFFLNDNRQGTTLVQLSDLSLQGLTLDDQLRASFDQLGLQNLGLLKPSGQANYWQHQQNIQLRQFQYHPEQGIDIKEITLTGGEYQLQLAADGKISELQQLQQTLASIADISVREPTENIAPNNGSKQPLAVTLHHVSMTAPNHFRFSDQRLSKPFNGEFSIEKLSLNNIQLSQPAAVSDFIFKGRFGEFSEIAINGDVMLFAKQPELNLEGKLAEISLPQISPYMEAYMGYQLQTGQYDHDFIVKISQQHIDMSNELNLRQLALLEVDADSVQPMTEHLDIPLPMALDLLRDGDGHIKLNVPIKGNLNEPGIGVNSIVNKALAKALQKGSLSYLSYALQPYGAALMAVNYLADKASTIQFDPLLFTAASAEISPEHQRYIEKLAALLQQREAINLTLCGRSNNKDKQQLQSQMQQTEDQIEPVTQKQLLALADQRAKQIKHLFAKYQIEGKRLFLCKPGYSDDEQAGVLLSM